MPAAVWGRTFEQVVFPLLAELLQRTMDGRLKDERLMQRATTLLSKAFLHHLHHLLALPSFAQLWLRALELLDQADPAVEVAQLDSTLRRTTEDKLRSGDSQTMTGPWYTEPQELWPGTSSWVEFLSFQVLSHLVDRFRLGLELSCRTPGLT